MDTNLLTTKFARIGARLKVLDPEAERIRLGRMGFTQTRLNLNVRSDKLGEYFEVLHQPRLETLVLDVQPADQHLLLLVRSQQEKSKFLCGHDERHLFVAAIPEAAPVGNVRQAKEALKPEAVLRAQSRQRLRAEARNLRKNAAYRRQGEWFFMPAPNLIADESRVLRNEPLVRSTGGKPHWVDYCYRHGGETVWVCRRYPHGIPEKDYRRLLLENSNAKSWPWRVMTRGAQVFVRGRVRHADHATITLHGWHEVLMNTESQAKAMQHVTFLD
jgi:hypothetical protein